jgi:DNA polymerase-4
MGGRQARRLCPNVIAVSPRMSAYSEASKAVFEVFDETTPVVEGLSIDEAFSTFAGSSTSGARPTEIAVQLRSDVGEHVGLPITVGVARTKFLAKVASGVAKPDGLLVVPPDDELAFLHPPPGRAALGCRRGHLPASSTGAGIRTVGQVAEIPQEALVFMLGRASGRHLHALCPQPRPPAGRGRSPPGLDRLAARPRPPHTEDVGGRRRGRDRTGRPRHPADATAGRIGRTVVLRLRFDDFSRVTRSHTLPRATSHTQTILATVRWLLAAAMPLIERRGVTLVGIAVANLEDDRAVQLGLPFDPQSGIALDAALDEVRERFGSAAVTRAVLVGRDLRPSMPLLPDRPRTS